MAKYQRTIHCIDFNDQQEVRNLLTYLRKNRATISAWEQRKGNFNMFAIVTKYREKETKK